MGAGVSLRLRLPATSANLGAAFDTAAVALGFALEIEADAADSDSIVVQGRDAEQCGSLEGNLILETYRRVLQREGRSPRPLALRMRNGIPLGMGCGSSAAGRLAGILLAVEFGKLSWTSEQILNEASVLEGHPDNAAACWLGGLAIASWQGNSVLAARVEIPPKWRALLAIARDPVPTSRARSLLPAQYCRTDAVANVQAAALLGVAFSQGRGDLLRAATTDRIHQPYRGEICPLLPRLLPLAGREGILAVALSGAGPSVLLIVEGEESLERASKLVWEAVGSDFQIELLAANFEACGAKWEWTGAQVRERETTQDLA
jgi:homoserine kinase